MMALTVTVVAFGWGLSSPPPQFLGAYQWHQPYSNVSHTIAGPVQQPERAMFRIERRQ